MRFRAFDFVFDSDVAFPELEPVDEGVPSICLERDLHRPQTPGVRWFRSLPAGCAEPWLRIGRVPGSFLLEFAGGLSIRYAPPEVRWSSGNAIAESSFRHLFLDQALPFLAAHEGNLVVHAACAARDGRGILIVGPAGTGKSTLAAALLNEGWEAAADDAVAVRSTPSGCLAVPSYAGLRLWPDACEALGYSGGESVAEYSDKRRFRSRASCRPPFALDAVYLVSRGDTSEGIYAITQRDALVALLRNTYVLDVEDPECAARQFQALAAVVAMVPVRRLAVRAGLNAVRDACRLIERDRAG